MIKIIIKFWPVFIPIILYFVWFLFFRKKKEDNESVPDWESRLWIIALSSSLVVALVTIIVLAFSAEEYKAGVYKPTEYKDGKLIPGRIVPSDE